MPKPMLNRRAPLKLRKTRSALYLHRLWKKAEKRALFYNEQVRKVLYEIVNNITPNQNGEYIVYASDSISMYTYTILYDENKDTFSYYRYTDTITRMDRGRFISMTLDEKVNTLGDRFYECERLGKTKLHKTVYDYFWAALTDKLDKLNLAKSLKEGYGNFIVEVSVDSFVYTIGVKHNDRNYTYTRYNQEEFTISLNRKKHERI